MVYHRWSQVDQAGQPYSEIEAAYFALLAKAEKPITITVAWLCGAYLDDVERTRSEGTFDWYRCYLEKCVAFFGPTLKRENLAAATVGRWIEQDYGSCSPSTQNGAARAIVRVMNWAVVEGHISRSPLAGYTKPTPSGRETYVTPEQYAQCLEHAKGPFRDLLVFLRETGCRPQEVRAIEAGSLDGRSVVLPVERSKGRDDDGSSTSLRQQSRLPSGCRPRTRAVKFPATQSATLGRKTPSTVPYKAQKEDRNR